MAQSAQTFLFFCALAIIASAQNVQQAFEESELVPDILDVAPTLPMRVVYPGNLEVNLGNELKPSQAQIQPEIVEWDAQPDVFYTFTMVDPDYPGRVNYTFRSIKHWLIGNVLGGDITTGDELATYVGLAPPENSGIHRYAFLVYIQENGRIDFTEGDFRYKFSLRDFTAEYELGLPIFGNFYVGQYETVNTTNF